MKKRLDPRSRELLNRRKDHEGKRECTHEYQYTLSENEEYLISESDTEFSKKRIERGFLSQISEKEKKKQWEEDSKENSCHNQRDKTYTRKCDVCLMKDIPIECDWESWIVWLKCCSLWNTLEGENDPVGICEGMIEGMELLGRHWFIDHHTESRIVRINTLEMTRIIHWLHTRESEEFRSSESQIDLLSYEIFWSKWGKHRIGSSKFEIVVVKHWARHPDTREYFLWILHRENGNIDCKSELKNMKISQNRNINKSEDFRLSNIWIWYDLIHDLGIDSSMHRIEEVEEGARSSECHTMFIDTLKGIVAHCWEDIPIEKERTKKKDSSEKKHEKNSKRPQRIQWKCSEKKSKHTEKKLEKIQYGIWEYELQKENAQEYASRGYRVPDVSEYTLRESEYSDQRVAHQDGKRAHRGGVSVVLRERVVQDWFVRAHHSRVSEVKHLRYVHSSQTPREVRCTLLSGSYSLQRGVETSDSHRQYEPRKNVIL